MSSINGSTSTGIGGAASDVGAASLEDCCTNIFHITELTGLKWCCLVSASDQQQQHQSRPISAADSASGGPNPSADANTAADASPSGDTVLRAYAQCSTDGILCAWRRRQPPSATAAYESPVPRTNAAKELWIFWYSADEPKHIEQFKAEGLAVLVHSETVDMDSPRVEFEYETRTLFFKALNTAIERRLLAEGFIRFGHWLCRPLESPGGGALSREDHRALPHFVNAVRFRFFLHRDSLVCASLCVQRQPTILRLGKAQLRERTRAQPVILAPWSIRATLVPGQHDLLRLVASSYPTSSCPSTSSPVLSANDAQQQQQQPLFVPSTSSPAAEEEAMVSTASVSASGDCSLSAQKKAGEHQQRTAAVVVKRESIDNTNNNTGDTRLTSSPPSVCSARPDKNEPSAQSCDDTNDTTGNRTTAANISTVFDRQWTEWKRIYQNLADPTQTGLQGSVDALASSAAPSPQTNPTTTTARSTTANVASGRNSSGTADAGGEDSSGGGKQHSGQPQQQRSMPRLVLVEVNGHRMLYPCQFVAVLADELLPPRPKRGASETAQPTTTTTTTGKTTGQQQQQHEEEQGGGGAGTAISTTCAAATADSHGPTTVPSSENALSSAQRAPLGAQHRMRRRSAIGQCAARCSFEDALLLPRQTMGASQKEPQQQPQFQPILQQQQQHSATNGRTLDEFNYDYARREFCYCPICHGGTKNAVPSATATTPLATTASIALSSPYSTASTTVVAPLTPTPTTTAQANFVATAATPAAAAVLPPPSRSIVAHPPPPAPFHHRHATNKRGRSAFTVVDPSFSSLSSASVPSSFCAAALPNQQQQHVEHNHQQQQHKMSSSSSRKKTVPPLAGGKGSSSSKSNVTTKSGGAEDGAQGGQPRNRWAHGCCTAATASSSTTTTTASAEWPIVPECDLLKNGSMFASRRKTQQQLLSTAAKRTAEGRQETAPSSGPTSAHGTPHSAAATAPIDSALAELLADEDDGMATDGGDGCDPIGHHHHQIQDLMLLGHQLGHNHHSGLVGCPPGMALQSEAVSFLASTQQRQRAATFCIAQQQHQQLYYHHQQQQQHCQHVQPVQQQGHQQQQLIIKDSELFSVDPCGALPPLSTIGEEKPMPPPQHHQTILERLLLSPAGGGGMMSSMAPEMAECTTTTAAPAPSTTTMGDGSNGGGGGAEMDVLLHLDQQHHQHHTQSVPSSSSFAQQYQPPPPPHQQQLHQQTQDVQQQKQHHHQHHLPPSHSASEAMMPAADAESMPNAETPPALLDTSAAGSGASTEQQMAAAAEELANQLQRHQQQQLQQRQQSGNNNRNERRKGATADGEEEEQGEEEEMEMMMEEGEDEGRDRDNSQNNNNSSNTERGEQLVEEEEECMMSMSSIDTSPASTTSPATTTGPSSVGGQPGGGVSAIALLLRGGGSVGPPPASAGDDHHQSQQQQQHAVQLLNPHHILSPPASNERIDSAVGSVNSQQQQQHVAATALQGGVGGPTATTVVSAAAAAIFASQIPHDTLSRIYPTPPTPMQQFSPQNVLLLPPSHHHQQHVQAVHGDAHHEPVGPDEAEQQLQQVAKTVNFLDTMVQLGDRLSRLTDETPLYDGVKARPPMAMFGLFAGDLLNEKLSPEERIRQCCGSSIGGDADAKEPSESTAESKSKLMRELHDHLSQRRKRLAERCHGPSSSDSLATTTSAAAVTLLPAYTIKRAKLAMAEQLAADKADGDAGLDARLQELERLRFRGTTAADEFLHQPGVANGQFAPPPSLPPHQWAPWHNGGGGAVAHFPHLPSAIPHSMLINQHHQLQQQQRSILPPMPPPPHNFSASQLFPPSGSLRMPSNVTMPMGQNVHRLPLSGLVNPMRSPPSFPPTPSSSSAPTPSASSSKMYQQQHQHMLFSRQQQLMAAGVASLSRSPSVTALQQQQPLLQRRSSALAMISPTGTAPTPAAIVSNNTTTTCGGASASSSNVKTAPSNAISKSNSTAATVVWDTLLQDGRVGARCSARMALLVQDTVADLHYDIVFDACPLCCCNSNIRSAELGIYIGAPRALLLRCDQLQRRQRQQQLTMAGGGSGAGTGGGGGAVTPLPKQWSGFRIVPTAELQKCNCGFSAVRHRYLCGRGSGLFADDIAEAGGFLLPPPFLQQRTTTNRRAFRPLFGRFNPGNPGDRQFVDLLMHLSIGQDMAAMVRSSRCLAALGGAVGAAAGAEQPLLSSSSPSVGGGAQKRTASSSSDDYTHSPVDIYELNGVMNGILELIMPIPTNGGSGVGNAIQPQQQSQTTTSGDGGPSSSSSSSIVHPWGYQTADGVGEPRDVECLALFEELKECFFRTAPPHAVASLAASAAAAPMIPSYSNGRRLEQLTLRSFARKGLGGKETMGGGGAAAAAAMAIDAENGRAEPIPHVLVLSHAEREPILVSAQVLRDWDRLELMPADQCKDVLYLTVVPDVNVVVSKCKVYMEELSNMYERRCRLGIHVPIGIREAPRDGILRVGRAENNSNNSGASSSSGSTPAAASAAPTPSFSHAVHAMFAQFGPEMGDDVQPILQRLRSFVDGCYAELCRFFLHNDHLFERRAFHESAYRQQQQPAQGTSLASVPDTVAMPPPAAPSASGGGVQSGPASATSAMFHHHQQQLQQHNTPSGPGSSSAAVVLHSSPMASTPHHHHQQTSPVATAAVNNGPNSVPILHGCDGSSGAAASTASMAAALQRQTAEEMAQFEEKLAADLNVITGELENTAYLPHVVVCYLVNPFGMFGSDAVHRQLSVFASAVLLRMWNEFLQTMPPKRRPQLQLELLSLRSVYDYVAFVGGGSDCLGDAIASAWGDDASADFCAAAPTRCRERSSAQDELKRTAFSVFTQPRILRPHIALDAMSKSMTRFGSMERMKDIIQMFGDSPLFFKFNCNPFLLAPARSFAAVSLLNNSTPGLAITTGTSTTYSASSSSSTASSANGTSKGGGGKLPLLLCPDGERVLFLAYCILPGDDWLCAAVTDERGTLLDTTLVNLCCPPAATAAQPAGPGKEWRHRQRHSQIADALQRLWMFAQSVMLTQEVRNWRLVIGRMGKLGHGEFKQWTEILSKKNLKSRNNALKGKAPPEESGAVSAPCQSCAQSHGWAETPALLSACLVSTEPEPYLRVMASTSPGALGDNVSGGAAGAAGGAGSGAGGGVVKPSGAGGAGSSGGGSNTVSLSGAAAGNKPAMGSAGAGRQSVFGGASVGTQQQWWSQTAAACPDDRSVTHIMVFQTILNVSLGHHPGEDLLQNAFDDDGDLTNVLGGFNFVEQNQEELDLDNLEIDKDEETQINNQPMAIGYTVSTAPLPSGMPSNFWHRCPAARRRAGAAGVAHLRSSLHINTSNLNEEYGSSGGGATAQQREQRDSGGAGAATASSSVGGGAKASSVEQQQQQQLQHAQHPLDAVATDDVLRYVLETYNALSWLSLDPVTGARRSCLPVHMQAIQRLNLAMNTFWGGPGSGSE